MTMTMMMSCRVFAVVAVVGRGAAAVAFVTFGDRPRDDVEVFGLLASDPDEHFEHWKNKATGTCNVFEVMTTR